jgi:uncharacterized membrane protein
MKQKCKIIFAVMIVFSFAVSVFSQDSSSVVNSTTTTNSTNNDLINLTVPLTLATDLTPTQEQSAKTTDVRINFGGQVSYNDITGPGKASSSLSQGVRHFENLGINVRGSKNDLKYQLNVSGRATNDERVDPIFVALTSLQARFEYKNHFFKHG